MPECRDLGFGAKHIGHTDFINLWEEMDLHRLTKGKEFVLLQSHAPFHINLISSIQDNSPLISHAFQKGLYVP